MNQIRDWGNWTDALPTLSIFAMIPFVAVSFWLKPKPPSPPPNSAAFGCYVAGESAPILLSEAGLTVPGSDLHPIGFDLTWQKTGIVILTHAPIELRATSVGYRWIVSAPGSGTFMDFERIDGNRHYGVFDPGRLTTISTIASDGHELLYLRTARERCRR